MRGVDLFYEGVFEKVAPDTWLVDNLKTRSTHLVRLDKVTCNCKDFEIHGHNPEFKCKHIIAADLKDRWLRKNVRELAGFFGGEAA